MYDKLLHIAMMPNFGLKQSIEIEGLKLATNLVKNLHVMCWNNDHQTTHIFNTINEMDSTEAVCLLNTLVVINILHHDVISELVNLSGEIEPNYLDPLHSKQDSRLFIDLARTAPSKLSQSQIMKILYFIRTVMVLISDTDD